MTSKAKTAGSVADKLREARALIERGWCQFNYCNGDKLCTLGAIGQVATGEARMGGTAAAKPLHDMLQKATGAAFVWQWNDAPGRTQAEVLAAFDKAIALAEAGQ